jgi:CO dehydrogenase/acetyl-CoA synthase delta subunit
MTQEEMLDTLFRRFDIDDIEGAKREDVTIEETDNEIKLSVDYEVRSPVLLNVDAVVYFNESILVKR